MPSTRFAVSAVVAVGLLAGACGGDEDSPSEGQAEVVSIIEGDGTSTDALDPSSPGTESTSPDAGQAEAPSGEVEALSPEAPSEGEDTAEPGPVDLITRIEQVELGDRFDWCSDIQETWDEYIHELTRGHSAEIALAEAQAAYEAATDELDRIEALDAFEEATKNHNNVFNRIKGSQSRAFLPIARAASTVYGVRYGETLNVAMTRAWETLSSHLDASTTNSVMLYVEQEIVSWAIPTPEEPELSDQLTDDILDVVTDDYGLNFSRSKIPLHLLQDPYILAAWMTYIEESEIIKDAFAEETGTGVDWVGGDVPLQQARREANEAIRALRRAFEAIASSVILPVIQAEEAATEAIKANGEAALAQILADDAAYGAFRASFQESCQG